MGLTLSLPSALNVEALMGNTASWTVSLLVQAFPQPCYSHSGGLFSCNIGRIKSELHYVVAQVLDAIDANRSAVVCAPTSSGKTFISSYCIDRVSKADEEGVAVFVAPTKALVNQVAAQVRIP